MVKRCIICGDCATFMIKNSSECYCEECAEEQFGDVSYLQKIDCQAKKLKAYLRTKVGARYEYGKDEA